MKMIYMADSIDICGDLNMVWTIFGYIILAIQIVVPLLLIISGMITMAKAIMEKDEKKIKEAQNLLIKKLIAAVITFLIIAVVKMVVRLVASDNWEGCARCALSPFAEGCGFEKGEINIPSGMIVIPGFYE